jgi:predicted transcriptional regulator
MPKKSDSRLVSAWVDRALSEELAELARENERSISAEVRIAVRDRLERERIRSAA